MMNRSWKMTHTLLQHRQQWNSDLTLIKSSKIWGGFGPGAFTIGEGQQRLFPFDRKLRIHKMRCTQMQHAYPYTDAMHPKDPLAGNSSLHGMTASVGNSREEGPTKNSIRDSRKERPQHTHCAVFYNGHRSHQETTQRVMIGTLEKSVPTDHPNFHYLKF